MGIEPVHSQRLYELLTCQAAFWQEVFVAREHIVVHNVEDEVFLAQLKGVEGVDVFHHQVPKREVGAQVGAFEKLEKEYGGVFLRGGHFLREFAHAKEFSVHGVFVGHGEDLVVVERTV